MVENVLVQHVTRCSNNKEQDVENCEAYQHILDIAKLKSTSAITMSLDDNKDGERDQKYTTCTLNRHPKIVTVTRQDTSVVCNLEIYILTFIE